MKICIAGKNNIAVNAVKYILDNDIVKYEDIYIIPNKGDKGFDTWQRSLRKFAISNKLRLVKFDDVYAVHDILVISLECDKLINTKKFLSDKLFNIHFSKLPSYKGMYTSALPILYGEKETGVTLHKIDDGIDTGEIVDQIVFPITINDTAKSLYMKYIEQGLLLFQKNINKLIIGKYCLKEQDNINSTYYSKESIDYSNIHIDFNKTAFEIHNQLRAFIFKEYQLPTINGFAIIKTVLSSNKMRYPLERNEYSDRFEISGTDRYIVKAYKKQ